MSIGRPDSSTWASVGVPEQRFTPLWLPTWFYRLPGPRRTHWLPGPDFFANKKKLGRKDPKKRKRKSKKWCSLSQNRGTFRDRIIRLDLITRWFRCTLTLRIYFIWNRVGVCDTWCKHTYNTTSAIIRLIAIHTHVLETLYIPNHGHSKLLANRDEFREPYIFYPFTFHDYQVHVNCYLWNVYRQWKKKNVTRAELNISV